ncbi:hypothetical protein D3C81_1421550 [compost metagenome]
MSQTKPRNGLFVVSATIRLSPSVSSCCPYATMASSKPSSMEPLTRRCATLGCQANVIAIELSCAPEKFATTEVTGNWIMILPSRSATDAMSMATNFFTHKPSAEIALTSDRRNCKPSFSESASSMTWEPFQKLFFNIRLRGIC